jgi:hypothetical protein
MTTTTNPNVQPPSNPNKIPKKDANIATKGPFGMAAVNPDGTIMHDSEGNIVYALPGSSAGQSAEELAAQVQAQWEQNIADLQAGFGEQMSAIREQYDTSIEAMKLQGEEQRKKREREAFMSARKGGLNQTMAKEKITQAGVNRGSVVSPGSILGGGLGKTLLGE